MLEIWIIELLPKALKNCPKSTKLPNLVTLFMIILFFSITDVENAIVRRLVQKRKIFFGSLKIFNSIFTINKCLDRLCRVYLPSYLSRNSLTSTMSGIQCDQIGRFLKVLGDNYSYKSSPNVTVTVLAIKKHYSFR